MQWVDFDILRYDEESPSGLVWNCDIFSGLNYQIRKIREGQTAGSYSGNSRGGFYFKFQYNKVKYLCHKVIWQMFHGEIPEGFVVDHEDGNSANNKIDNLRLVTQFVNSRNAKKYKSNKSGCTGVYFKSQNGYDKWVAQWQDSEGNRRSKSFSVNKYGNDARRLAEEMREGMIRINNVGYTERHGRGVDE